MEQDIINEYKKRCGEYFEQKGMTVLFDVAISPIIRWRPHVFAKNGSLILLDIIDEESLPEFYIKKFIKARNLIPELKIYLGLVGESKYAFEFFGECAKYGFGILKINSGLKLLLETAEPTVEGIREKGQLAIAHDKPYGNIISLKKCLRSCKSHISWLERNLPKNVMETIYEANKDGDINGIDSIQLLRAVDDDIDGAFKDEFRKFKIEMQDKGICVELRVIVDPVSKSIHGRYLYSKDADGKKIQYQLPPLNSLKANQWDTILTNVEVVPSFEQLWAKGFDLLTSWEQIKVKIQEYLKNKSKILEKEAKRLRTKTV